MNEELNNLIDDILKEKLKLHYENEELEAQGKLIKELCKEIERLNNIISNLEIYVRKRIELCYELGCTREQFDIWNSIEMRIKELKGSDKE